MDGRDYARRRMAQPVSHCWETSMSAPHPRYPDNSPSLKRVLAAFAPPAELNAIDELESEFTLVRHPPHDVNLLEELAVILRRLTYGQMVEFSTGINADPKNIEEWSHK